MVKPISLKQIKSLREATGAGIMEAKKALIASGGEVAKAQKLLARWGAAKIAERGDKATNEGQIFAYVHHDGRLASLVKLTCETDFVARSGEFQVLGKELSLQVASMEPANPAALLQQPYVRDSAQTVAELINATAVKVKEKLTVTEIVSLKI